MSVYVVDIETFPNVFTLTMVDVDTCECTVFEISDRINQGELMRAAILTMKHDGSVMVGFNNEHFDYPVIHHLMNQQEMTAKSAYDKAMEIINTPWEDKFRHYIWDNARIVPQIDLFKIHHFDNANRSTSLKMLEFNMRSDSIQDLPFEVGTNLDSDQIETLKTYNIHDVVQTWRFYNASEERINFRKQLSRKHQKNFMNFNDTKIGKEFFIMELEKAGIPCFTQNPRKPIQTPRPSINLRDAVLPSIQFKHPEFNRILSWFKTQTVGKENLLYSNLNCDINLDGTVIYKEIDSNSDTEIIQLKGVFNDVNCTVNDFTFNFGLGGIHGSVEATSIESDDTHVIIDLDVASYYSNLAIVNRFFPEHLSEKFCDIYTDVYAQRRSYPKKSAENEMLKLALNGVYGDSNNKYSPFYDPLYTMKITVNGQLLLCMLAERLMGISKLEMIQINTDGLTIRVPHVSVLTVQMICADWEHSTGLELENNMYSRMWIRDVNNYIAEYTDGELKRKGAYGYTWGNPPKSDLDWNQDHGGLVIAKAAEAALVHGDSVRRFIETHTDMYDFYLVTKVPRSSHLLLVDDNGNEQRLQNITRYYASADKGGYLVKVMPPLPKKPDVWRRFDVQKGWRVQPCNHINEATARINYEYYIQRAEKLLV